MSAKSTSMPAAPHRPPQGGDSPDSDCWYWGGIDGRVGMGVMNRGKSFSNSKQYIAYKTYEFLSGFTAGLPISLTWGLRHNFCCRGPILIPRPVLESPAQTTRGNVPDFFVRPKNGISASYTKRR